MFVPDILTAPLRRTDDRTSDYPLLDDGEVQIGIWECTPGALGDGAGDFDETMYMVAGRASVGHSGGTYDLSPGTLWITPRNWTSEWNVHQTIRKLYVIDQRPGSAAASAHLPVAHTATLGEPTRRPVVIVGDPHESSSTLWAQNQLDCGVWECTPGEFPFRRDGCDEVFCLISGHVTLHVDTVEGSGHAFDLRAGSVMLTPAGMTGRWVVHETIRKAYTIVHR